MLDLEARVLGGQVSMVGPVRITMPPYFAVELIEECRDFAREYPDIELELVATDELNNISKREADIAVRVASKSKIPDHLVGRKMSECAIAVFGVPELQDVPWEDRPWLGWIDSFSEDSTMAEYRLRHGGEAGRARGEAPCRGPRSPAPPGQESSLLHPALDAVRG